MNRIRAIVLRPLPAHARRSLGCVVLVAAVAGCGSSTEVGELPEAAKKTLIQKKVDVQPRPSQSKPSRR